MNGHLEEKSLVPEFFKRDARWDRGVQLPWATCLHNHNKSWGWILVWRSSHFLAILRQTLTQGNGWKGNNSKQCWTGGKDDPATEPAITVISKLTLLITWALSHHVYSNGKPSTQLQVCMIRLMHLGIFVWITARPQNYTQGGILIKPAPLGSNPGTWVSLGGLFQVEHFTDCGYYKL